MSEWLCTEERRQRSEEAWRKSERERERESSNYVALANRLCNFTFPSREAGAGKRKRGGEKAGIKVSWDLIANKTLLQQIIELTGAAVCGGMHCFCWWCCKLFALKDWVSVCLVQPGGARQPRYRRRRRSISASGDSFAPPLTLPACLPLCQFFHFALWQAQAVASKLFPLLQRSLSGSSLLTRFLACLPARSLSGQT